MISQHLWDNFPLKKMTNSTDPKSTNPGTSHQQPSTQSVSVQSISIVVGMVIGVAGFQWQLGNLVSSITVQLTRSDLQIQELKEDVRDIKLKLK